MSNAEQDVVRRAIEHLDRGEDQEALALLGPHVLEHPDDVEALFRLGIATARTQRLVDAIRMFSRVVELDPTHGRALWNLGRAQLALDDPHAAEPYLRLAIRLAAEEPELWTDLAVALRSIHRAHDARELLEEACRKFPDDVYMKARLLAVELQDGVMEAASRTADRIETLHADEPVAAAAVLQFCLESRDRERARRAAARLVLEPDGSVVDYEDLLRDLAAAFPPPDDAILRRPERACTCPACGARSLRSEIAGIVLDGDPLARLAAVGVCLAGNRCDCGLRLPSPRAIAVLYPSLSIAVLVDAFPAEEHEVSDVTSAAVGGLGEPASAKPAADVWFAFSVSGPSALPLALAAREAAEERRGSLPEIGELGRAERRARETVTALRVMAGLAGEAEVPAEERAPLPDWMRIEREALLTSGIDCGPWPLSHVCRCGASLGPFLFGSDRDAPFDPGAIDDAAIAGRPFRDGESGEPAFGFNCDACGRLHTWLLGVVP